MADTLKRYEYAVFTIRLAFPEGAFNLPMEDWPYMPHQTSLLEKMNELGAQGWEIFERARPIGISPIAEFYPYNLWARREVRD